MSFFSNAVKSISLKQKTVSEIDNNQHFNSLESEERLQQNFSCMNYAKKSFSVMITRPLSSYVMKVIRCTSLIIAGAFGGITIATIGIAILLQFGSLENGFVSSFIISKFEKLCPESDIAIKSASLHWNKESNTVEIEMKRVKMDDLILPRVTITPNYLESLKQQKLITKSISITNPKIALNIDNDFKNIYINPNFEKGTYNTTLMEPISSISHLKDICDSGTSIKLINAEAYIHEHGTNWNLKKIYCEHIIGEEKPKCLAASLIISGQKYISRFNIERVTSHKNKESYRVSLDSVNPNAIMLSLQKRDTPINRSIASILAGHNIPITGTLVIDLIKDKLQSGSFDIVASNGSIKLPIRNSLSINLGKRIDNGRIVGKFSEDKAIINSLNLSYGDSSLQLTGIDIPLSSFEFLDVANIDGTLSINNIDIQELENILPKNISKTITPTFKDYLPGFKLELFKLDIKGPVAFGRKANTEKLHIGNGVFQVKNAQIPLGDLAITNVDANGKINPDGMDIRLNNANFNGSTINTGEFFISSKDNSWIGTVNVDVSINNMPPYLTNFSKKLSMLPIEKLDIEGNANLDLKLVHIAGADSDNNSPFKIVAGEGVFKSKNNTRELNLSWGDKGLNVTGDVSAGKYNINLKINEDLANNSGNSQFYFTSNSEFLDHYIPCLRKFCDGDFKLNISNNWKEDSASYDISLDLKDSTFILPIIGNLKLKKDDGTFTAHIEQNKDILKFTKMSYVSNQNKIIGEMVVRKDGTILKCSLNEFYVDGMSAKINMVKTASNKIRFSCVGDRLNLSNVISDISKCNPNLTINAYVDLKEAFLSDQHSLKNVKGHFDIKGGKLFDGACYAVLGDSTTLALSVNKNTKDQNKLLTVSASDAGEFLKHMKITNAVSGGNITIATRLDNSLSSSLSGYFEIKDFIMSNNKNFTKLISLSSSSILPNSENVAVGFNACVGKFVFAGDKITIENGQAIGPAFGISFDGSYDRINDYLEIKGIAANINNILNTRDNIALASNYTLNGSIDSSNIAVQELQRVRIDRIYDAFGMLLSNRLDKTNMTMEKDPFANRAFDTEDSFSSSEQSSRSTTSNKYGIKITRGRNKS